MRANMTNKEEAECLKQWWKSYGQGILLAVIIGLCIGAGYRYFSSKHQQAMMNASNIYQQTLALGTATSANMDAAAKALEKNYPKSIYTQLSQLQTAEKLVEQKKYQEVITILQSITVSAKMPGLVQLASLKEAQLYLQLNQPQKALNAVTTVTDESFQAMIDSIKASAYAQLNQPVQAQTYLQKAIAGYNALKINTTLLRLNQGLK